MKIFNMEKRDIVKAILLNNQDEVLVIRYKDNFYDLPGGAVEKNETPEQALLRELDEETDYINFKIIEKLGEKELQYNRRGVNYQGKIYVFVVSLIDRQHSEQTDPERNIFGKINSEWMKLEDAVVKIKEHKESRAQKMAEFLEKFQKNRRTSY